MTPLNMTQQHHSPIHCSAQNYLFEEKLRLLKEFKDKHGHCNVTCAQDNALGHFVAYLRHRKRYNMLSADRCKKVEELGFEWDVPEKKNQQQDSKPKKTTKEDNNTNDNTSM